MTHRSNYEQPRCKMIIATGQEAIMLGESDKHDEYSEDPQLAGEGYFEEADVNWGYKQQKTATGNHSVWDD